RARGGPHLAARARQPERGGRDGRQRTGDPRGGAPRPRRRARGPVRVNPARPDRGGGAGARRPRLPSRYDTPRVANDHVARPANSATIAPSIRPASVAVRTIRSSLPTDIPRGNRVISPVIQAPTHVYSENRSGYFMLNAKPARRTSRSPMIRYPAITPPAIAVWRPSIASAEPMTVMPRPMAAVRPSTPRDSSHQGPSSSPTCPVVAATT